MKAKITTSTLLILFLVFMAGCASGPKYNPFLVPQETLRASVKTIAIYHPKTNNPVEIQFAQLIEEQLNRGGFATVGPDRVNPVAAREIQSVGGLYDPETGVEDKAKSDLFWRNLFHDLKTNFNADAMLTFEVVGRRANFYGNRAEWDGTSEGMYMHNGVADLLLQNGTEYGTTKGLSLKILLTDQQRHDLYLNYGGIQLATKLSRPAQLFRQDAFVEVPKAKLFCDTNRIYGAVTNAMGPLVNLK